MTDTIFITGLVIHARHGVMEHETEVGQRFVIDLELSADLSESSRTDRLADTVSYSNVVATATAAFKNANYKLLERAAGAVAEATLAAFPRISAVKVTVHKPHAPIAAIFDDVGIVLTRAQNMREVNTKRKLVRVLPSEKSVERLIAQARKLQPKITY